MSRQQDTNRKLSTFANSLETASEALQDIVSQGNEEEIRTRQFEVQYTKLQADSLQYKVETVNQDSKASKLKLRLEQEIMRRRGVVDSLKSEIFNLDKQIREQDQGNERLASELRDKVKQYNLFEGINGTYANA